jgi:hypothetical protein
MQRGAKHGAGRARWALGYRQFDLVRTDSGETYLTRWWLVDTPAGGICLHRMTAPDARGAVHDHPFSFVAVPVIGGYIEERLNRRDRRSTSKRVIVSWKMAMGFRDERRANVVRVGLDAHTITKLLRVPTWTLLLCGPQITTWGFHQPMPEGTYAHADEDSVTLAAVKSGAVLWTHHEDFDSGHYAPERSGRRS